MFAFIQPSVAALTINMTIICLEKIVSSVEDRVGQESELLSVVTKPLDK